MLDQIRDRSLQPIYVSIVLLGMAMSAAFAVIASQLRSMQFSTEAIGMIATILAAGGVLGAVPAEKAIRQIGAKVTLTLALIGFSAATAALPLLPSFATVAVVRFFEGICTVAIWIGFETLLMARAVPAARAAVTSLYAVALACGYVAGPVVTRSLIAGGRPAMPFFAAGAIGFAAAAVVLFLVEGPRGAIRGRTVKIPAPSAIGTIGWRIKTSCFAMFASGYLKSALILFLPLYLLEHRSAAATQPPIVLACFAAGWLPFASLSVRLSNRYGHLLLMSVLAFLGASALIGFLVVHGFAAMCIASAAAGATLNAITPLGMALQGNIVSAQEYPRAASLSNGFYAAGTLLGPPLTGLIYGIAGGAGILQIALLWLVFAVFCVFAAADDPYTSGQRARTATPL